MYSSQRYSQITLEYLSTLSLEELEDLRHGIDNDIADLTMQLECLQINGGVSKAMAANLGDYLPAGIVLESFTTLPTTTNYQVVTESLSKAVKVALGVAIVAGLGAIIFYATRASKREVSEPDVAAAKRAEDYANMRADMDKFWADYEAKEETARQARQQIYNEQDAQRKRLVENMPQNSVMVLMKEGSISGTISMGKYLVSLLNNLNVQLETDYRAYLIPAIDAAEKYSSTGDEAAIEKVASIDTDRPLKDVQRWSDLLSDYVKKNMDSAGYRNFELSDTSAGGAVRALVEWGSRRDLVTAREAGSVFERICKNDKLSFEVLNTKRVIEMVKEASKLSKDLPLQEKRLEKLGNIPHEITALLKGYIEATKQKLQVIEAIQGLVSYHVDAFNRAVALIGKDATDDLKRQVTVLEDIVSDPDQSPETKTMALKILEEIKKAMADIKK